MSLSTHSIDSETSTLAPMQLPQFRSLWFGLIFMSSGLQFYAVVLTWLVLDLTGSPMQVGTVLAIGAIPRAMMMLIAGAIIDRSKLRPLLVFAAFGNSLVVAIIALLLSANWLTIVILATAGALMGLLDAFFYPISFGLLPHLLHRSRLSQGNALMQGADGIVNMVAPAVSGLVVGMFGMVASLVFNAILFVCGAFIIRGIGSVSFQRSEDEGGDAPESQWQLLLNGFRFALSHPPIRLGILAIAALNFAAIGPIVVGGAVLVQERFGGESAMYGYFLGAFGAGSLVGTLIASMSRPLQRPGLVLVWTALALGVALLVIGVVHVYWLILVTLFMSSTVVGATAPFFSAWLQQETPLAMQGRLASLITFAAVAVDPLSQAVVGVFSQINVILAFCAPGLLLILIGVAVAFSRTAHTQVYTEGQMTD